MLCVRTHKPLSSEKAFLRDGKGIRDEVTIAAKGSSRDKTQSTCTVIPCYQNQIVNSVPGQSYTAAPCCCIRLRECFWRHPTLQQSSADTLADLQQIQMLSMG